LLDDVDSLMEQEGIDSLIAHGTAFDIPDIMWLTGFNSPDTITFFRNKGEESVVATGFLTLGRVTKESFIKKTFDLTELFIKMIKERKMMVTHPEVYLKEITDNLFTGEILGVPEHFPAQFVVALQQLGINIKVVPLLLKEARATKSSEEIKWIKKAGVTTIDAISKVVDMIANTEIGSNNVLLHKGEILTVGTIRRFLEHFLLDQSAEMAADAIVAVGKKGYDFHYLGKPNDKLKATVPIVIDVFPRLKKERYVADVSRTVVRRTPSKQVQQMFDAVYEANSMTVDRLVDGASMEDINLACFNTLNHHGFKSYKLHPGTTEGMISGLGHGIGLNIHEHPMVHNFESSLVAGNVVAIEPGVYLKAHGGVKVENDFVITKGKPKCLTLGLDEPLYL